MHYAEIFAVMAIMAFVVAFSQGTNAIVENNHNSSNTNATNSSVVVPAKNETADSSVNGITKNNSVQSILASNYVFVIDKLESNRSVFKLSNAKKQVKNSSELWYLIQGTPHNKVP